MKIVMLNRLLAEKVVPEVTIPHAVISITDPTNSDPAKFHENEFTKAVLYLRCYDLDANTFIGASDQEEVMALYGPGMFNDVQAEHIVNFVLAIKDSIKAIICHCDAGVSRSSGVGAAISLILNGSDQDVFNDRRYIPNMYIYRKIVDAYHRIMNNKLGKE